MSRTKYDDHIGLFRVVLIHSLTDQTFSTVITTLAGMKLSSREFWITAKTNQRPQVQMLSVVPGSPIGLIENLIYYTVQFIQI